MPNRQPKTLRQIMAENLRILRFAAHISQEELAELCGPVSYTHLTLPTT